MRFIGTVAVFGMLCCGARAKDADSIGWPPPRTASAMTQPDRNFGGPAAGRKLWIASIVALAAANAADAHSSWSRYEGNRALMGPRQKFGARGAAIKGGVNAAWVVGQVLWLRKNPAHRALGVVNLAAASVFAALAWHNYETPGPR